MSKPGRRLEKELEWHKIYSTPSHPRIYESKFASGEARISLSELRSRWAQWHEGERVQFAQAFGRKNTLDDPDDERVLEFLMEQDKGSVCALIAMLSTKYSDRPRAVRFLTHCIEAFPRDRANFLQALSWLAEPATVPVLSRIYRDSEAEIVKNPEDQESILNLLYSSVALFKLRREGKYRDTVARFLEHSNEAVRTNASLCMQELGKLEK